MTARDPLPKKCLTAAILADASPAIGGGHVIRCLSLAIALAKLGVRPVFAIPQRAIETVKFLAESGFAIHQVRETGPIEPADLPPHDIAVFDNYSWHEADERRWHDGCRTLVTIDDLANRSHCCDILVDQTPGREPDGYAALVPPDCAVLAGPAYALLRPEFREYRPAALARRSISGARKLLVSLGLTDVGSITQRVVEIALEAKLELMIDVIVGSSASSLPGLRRLENQGAPLRLHVDTSQVARLMTEADFSLGAGGSTSLERCCLGLPTLIVTTADNQREIAAALDARGAARYVGDAHSLSDTQIMSALQTFAEDDLARHDCTVRAAGMVDGLGADRVVSAVVARTTDVAACTQ